MESCSGVKCSAGWGQTLHPTLRQPENNGTGSLDMQQLHLTAGGSLPQLQTS
jgi:hypothetical protein